MDKNDEWKKLDSNDGYDYYLHEKIMPKEKPIISLSAIKTIVRNIKMHKEVLDILVAKGQEVVGFLEVGILEDNLNAIMTMQTQLAKLNLPNEIKDSKLNINRHNGAIFVDEEYRRKGIAKNMMQYMFGLLKNRNIKKLIVSNIKKEAKNLYENTGATFYDDKEASYDIEKMEMLNEPIKTSSDLEIE